jgi:hypothetical protein
MSNRLKNSYKPSSRIEKGSILTESIPAESIYSQSHYPLKKLSRYSNNRSPNKSNARSNNTKQQSYYEATSHHHSKLSYKSGQPSYHLDQPEYPEHMDYTPYSERDMRSEYTQNVNGYSSKQIRNFEKHKEASRRSKKSGVSKRQSDLHSQYSKKTRSKRYGEKASKHGESDYERFLQERYPDMVQSDRYTDRQEMSSRGEVSYQEHSKVGFLLHYFVNSF